MFDVLGHKIRIISLSCYYETQKYLDKDLDHNANKCKDIVESGL